ncbi:MAG: type IV pilus modification PilV family protein [Steroidobacteraceae bacterium]
MQYPMRCRGATLVELIVTIVVIGIALSGVLAVLAGTAERSAENMVQAQATLVAESYLNEILDKPFGNDVACSPGCSRPQMWVADYNRMVNVGVRDASGNRVVALGNYDVAVSVTPSALGVVAAELVVVTVTAPDGRAVTLSGYRTNS